MRPLAEIVLPGVRVIAPDLVPRLITVAWVPRLITVAWVPRLITVAWPAHPRVARLAYRGPLWRRAGSFPHPSIITPQRRCCYPG
jgi:hypothetical protein